MSQPQQSAPSTARTALAIGIVGLILGATGVGYAVYLGLSQVPSQLSSFPQVNQPGKTKLIRVEWTTALESGQDRFYPNYFTINQGDNITIIFLTNDTGDAHTFTTGLGMRGFTGSAIFQLNNSWIGLSSGKLVSPVNANFTGPADGCKDNNGNLTSCNTQKVGPGNCNNTVPTPPDCSLWSTGYLGSATTPGVYEFHCFFHQKAGMVGYLTVLPNKGPPA